MLLNIGRTWDGDDADPEHHTSVRLAPTPNGLAIEVDAPFFGDRPPSSSAGSTPRLWEHEVVEVFLLGADERYLEVELGPHGHYLVLALAGVRQVVATYGPLDYIARRSGARWRGRAEIRREWLPTGLAWANAYAMANRGSQRQYFCHAPTGGARPDFHRLEAFVPMDPFLVRELRHESH